MKKVKVPWKWKEKEANSFWQLKAALASVMVLNVDNPVHVPMNRFGEDLCSGSLVNGEKGTGN